MSVDLYFIGLFCHADVGGTDVVIAPTGPTNDPMLLHFFRVVVPKSGFISSANVTEDGVHASSTNTEFSFDMPGPLLIDGVVGTTRMPTADFQTDVPKLTNVSGHRQLRNEVQTRTAGGKLRAFIDHPPGVMAVEKWFANKGVFDPPVGSWTTPKCVAAVTLVSLATTGTNLVIRLNGGSARIELSPTVGYIIFWNEPLVRSTYYNDFSEYYASIFADTAVAESLPAERAIRCGRPTKIGSVECANSQFP
jgi:hypothetical protein